MTEFPNQPDPVDDEEEHHPGEEEQIGSQEAPTPGGYKGARDPKTDMPHMPSRPDAPEEPEEPR